MSRNDKLNKSIVRTLQRAVDSANEINSVGDAPPRAYRLLWTSRWLFLGAVIAAYANAKVAKTSGLARTSVFDKAVLFVEGADEAAVIRLAGIRRWLALPQTDSVELADAPLYRSATSALAATVPSVSVNGDHGDLPGSDAARQYFSLVYQAAQGRPVAWSTTSCLQQCIENLAVMVHVLRVPDAEAWGVSAKNLLRWYTAHCAIAVARELQPALVPRRPRPDESSRRPIQVS